MLEAMSATECLFSTVMSGMAEGSASMVLEARSLQGSFVWDLL